MPIRDGRGEPHAGQPLPTAIHVRPLVAVIDKVRGAARVLPLLSFVAAVSTAAFAADPAPGTHRVAFISSGPAAANVENFAAFKQGLTENGYVEGRNLVLDVRWANGTVANLPNLVNEALDAKPKVIISTGGAVTINAVKAATTSVPVVFISGDPVANSSRSAGLPATARASRTYIAGLAATSTRFSRARSPETFPSSSRRRSSSWSIATRRGNSASPFPCRFCSARTKCCPPDGSRA